MKKILITLSLFVTLQIFIPTLNYSQAYEGYLKPPKRLFAGFEAYTESVAIGDVNNDGFNDIVAVNTSYPDPGWNNKVVVFIQDRSGSKHGFYPPVLYDYINPISNNPTVLIEDVNNDGLKDVILDTTNGFGVYYQNGSGTLSDMQLFSLTHSYSGGDQGITVGDFNNDGRNDVVVPSHDFSDNKIEVFLQNLAGNFTVSTVYDAPFAGRNFGSGRINNDAFDDVVITEGYSIAVFYQNEGGFLDAAVEYDIGYSKYWLDVGDVNNDGRDDVVVDLSFGEDYNLAVFYQDAAGALITPPSTYYDLWQNWAMRIGDVNRDGRNDIILQVSNLLVAYQLAGGGFETDYVNYNTLGSQHGRAVDFGDINGDGWNDVVFARGANSGVTIHHGWNGADSLILSYPNGGEKYNIASYIFIWFYRIGNIDTVDIAYSINGGASWKIIKEDFDSWNDDFGSYAWTAPLTPSDNCLIRISGGSHTDVSYYPFSLIDDGVERLNILSPDDGDNLVPDSNFPLSWEYSGSITDVQIEYSTDNGTSWTEIHPSWPVDATYNWTVPDTPSTECKLRISDASDNDPTDTNDGTFTILDLGSEVINVTSPNGGEILTGGSTHNITWTSVGTIPNVHIEYSTNNGTSWTTIINTTANDGSHSWTVPNITSSQCLVRISDALDSDPIDQSNNVFSITPIGEPTLTVTSPNGGETFLIGIGQNITWTSTGYLNNVQIEYSIDDGTSWTIVTASTANDGSYTWTVPNTPSSLCLVRVSDASDGDPSDISNAVFTIGNPQPSITITSPQGGEYWQVGSIHDITWTTYMTVGNVKIEYSTNNKSTWNTIIASTTNDGSYSWTIPNTPSSSCFIKISEAADGFPYNISFSAFSIVTSSGGPEIGVNHTALYYGSLKSSSVKTPSQQIIVDNSSGFGTLTWQASDDAPWLILDNTAGTQTGIINASINPMGLSIGTHTGSITIFDPNASNSPQTISVSLTVYPPLSDTGPFGSFDTPVNGSTVMSSVPVTGWALDDIGIESVTLWRDSVQGEGSGQVYIGDAVLVEGARPDIEQTYPSYPMSYKAGWGYMMLTNFLPNGGNGTFKLYAYAKDGSGHEVLLGTKTITCDNAHAVKPFGAIDTPKQGGNANSSSFRNHGWVLTPMPNKIPENGSTIFVYIDGISLGNPTYNIFREDIAALFPGYANSSGAHAFLDFNTTTYSSGLHTIQWVAADNAGNADGIGSRYFSIQNPGYINQVAASGEKNIQEKEKIRHYHLLSQLTEIPVNKSKTIGFKTGYKKNGKPERIPVSKNGGVQIELREDNRIELHLAQSPGYRYSGYLVVGKQLRPLPTGSTLDRKTGVFYWQPGPGYIGKYELFFIAVDADEKMNKSPVTITFTPKFEIEKSL